MIPVELCIGLFGTCGTSRWREPFIKYYNRERISYYNPQVPFDTWVEECAIEEAAHLANDALILFPVTKESYGGGSLAEVGFSINQAIKLNEHRDVIVLIDPEIDPSLTDRIAREESLRARALAKQHIRQLRLSNVYLVETLGEMLELSVVLYRAAELRESVKRYSTAHGTFS